MATSGAQLAICGVSATGRTACDLLACVLSFFTGESKAVRSVSRIAPPTSLSVPSTKAFCSPVFRIFAGLFGQHVIYSSHLFR